MSDALKEIAQRHVLAKKAEAEAIAARRKIDAEIVELLKSQAKPEGTLTEKLEGFKVSVEYSVNRKVDTKKLQADWATLPGPVQAAINWKAELSTTVFRTLDKDAVLALSTYMESKPATPSVKVEITE